MFVRLVAVIGSLWLFSNPILRGIGSLLENNGPPAKADVVVVLAGDAQGNRILKGAELVRQGYAPAVIASNGGHDYDRTESQLAIEFATKRGYPASMFIETDWTANSTVEEASNAIALMRSRGVHKALIVTTTWHTARTGRIYRRLAPDMTFYLMGSNDPEWHNGDWWKDRQGKKVFFLEYSKTVADFLGI